MGKGIFVGIIAVFTVIILVVVAIALGLIPGIELPGLSLTNNDGPQGANKLSMSNTEIFQALEFLTGKNLSFMQINPYIDGLHMEMWGINGESAFDTLTWYRGTYENESYTSVGTTIQRGSGWIAYTQAWRSGINCKAVTVGDGSSVKYAYGYDTMILTSYGPLTDYLAFWSAVSSS